MNTRSLLVATAIGFLLGLIMDIAGHYIAFVRDDVFAIGGTVISLLAGFIYVQLAPGKWGATLLGGAISGGLSALLAIAISVGLGDVPMFVLAFGTAVSAVAGMVGAAMGKLIG